MNPELSTILALAKPHRYRLLAGSLLLMVENGALLSIPWIAGLYASKLFGFGDVSSILPLLLLLLLAVQGTVRFVVADMLGNTANCIEAALKMRLYDHLQSLPLDYLQRRRRGDLLALMTHEASQVGDFISHTLVSLLPQLVAVGGTIVLMLSIDPLLALLVTVLVPLFALVLKIVGRRLRPLAADLQQTQADNVAFIDENLEMLPAIKAFNREPAESALFRRRMEAWRSLASRQLRIHAWLEPLLQFIAAAGMLVLLSVAGERIAVEKLQPQELITFLLYAAMLTRPVGALAAVYGQLQGTRGALVHLQQVLNEVQEAHNHDGHVLTEVRGELRFHDVGFSYAGREPLFDSLNLHVRAGETVAIIGENGSGKSTLVQLLLRLHLPRSGSIKLDGCDISELNLGFLRDQIALVSQQVLLFNGTVGANIGYAKAGATARDIMQAARLAQAHDFISALPEGYDTIIGEQGIRLSGGQRQRLALARALLKQAPIVVLDEATAMFDPAAETSLLLDCRQLLEKATVILITHRPASLALADRILRLHEGRFWAVTPNEDTARPTSPPASAIQKEKP